MRHFYSATESGFCHGDNLPLDAVEITEAEYNGFFAAQIAGKVIRSDETGHPIAIDPPDPGDEELARRARAKRDSLLKSSDWTQLPDVSETVSSMWRVYRQALRDVTAQDGFPRVIEWPVAPGAA